MSAGWISKTKVGKAGEALTSPLSSSEDRAAALAVVNYWREIHAEVRERALEDIGGLLQGASKNCRRLLISSEERMLLSTFKQCTTLQGAG